MARKKLDNATTEPEADGLLIRGAPAEPAKSSTGYTVLARRYRSRSFDELIGQESISRTLKNAITMGRTAHAYLFCGTRGVGKTSMARIFARSLNATENLSQSEEIAASILRGEDLDVIEIDGASNRGVDDARDLISKAGIAPARSPYRIYIIDEVHMLTTPAFNAMLKTMEEPPAHVKFILCTTEPHKVPATIQSRCQRFDFRPIPTSRIAEHLRSVLTQERLQAEDEALQLVARMGNGSMRDALSLLDRLIAAADGVITTQLAEEVMGLPHATLLGAVTKAVVAGDAKAGLLAGAALLESGCPVEQAMELLAGRLRDLLVLRTCGLPCDLVDLAPEAKAIASSEAAHFQSEELVHLIAVCEAAHRALRNTGTPRTIFDATLARLCLHRGFEAIESSRSVGAADEKKKVGDFAAPAAPVAPVFKGAMPRESPSHPPVVAAPAARPSHVAATQQQPAPRTVHEAWQRVIDVATAPREAAIVESVEPVSMEDNCLRLRVARDAGPGAAFAARRMDPLMDLVCKALGASWKVTVEPLPESAPVVALTPHGLDADIASHPLVREAMEAFDAVIIKVQHRSEVTVDPEHAALPDAQAGA